MRPRAPKLRLGPMLFLVEILVMHVCMHANRVALVLSITVLLSGLSLSRPAEARDVADCKARWGSAVRSYLTQNRRAGPSGKVPKDMDEAEEVALAWIELFSEACRLEASGKKRTARLMAASLGTATLSRLDQVACQRFLHYFMKAKDPEDVCQAATKAAPEQVNARVTAALKHQKRLNVPWVSKRRSSR